MHCYKCAFEIKAGKKIGRQDFCLKCASALHCCRNCRFYAPDVHHQCRESEAEWVSEKESSNFCDYFEPLQEPAHRVPSQGGRKPLSAKEAGEKLRKMLKDLDRGSG